MKWRRKRINNMPQQRVLLTHDIYIKDLDSVKAISMQDYISSSGYKAVAKAVKELKREDIIEEVKRSNLRGRGGAGFPTWQKWEAVAKEEAVEKYLCCNGAEGEPGTYKDRCLILSNPHQLIEGIIIASYAIGAGKAYIYINEGYDKEIALLEKALKEAKEKGYIGERIVGSSFPLNINITKCPNKYIAGEETAMLQAIEGRDAKPWQKPPYYPAVRGLFGRPTVVNNIETISNIPHIILKGGEWFSKIGSEKSPGTMLFSLSGDINRPGVYELPLGTALKELINNCGGGIKKGMRFKAVFPAGPSNAPLTESQIDTPLEFDSLKEANSGLGCASVTVVGNANCIVNKAVAFSKFFMDESCGQCPACQMGTVKMFRLIQKIEDGSGEINDIADIENTCALLEREKVYCHLLKGAILSARGAIRNFRGEFESHIKDKKCPLTV
ncbi:MAG: SLBB domain-containing protein [Nitrospirae bacterium]|nr:SLBB domain-containing protein [Nitrospirota bacterium]